MMISGTMRWGGRNKFAVGAGLAAGLLAIFLIPLHVPVKPGISDAYMVGFNTRASLLLIALVSLGFAIWSRGLGLTLPETRLESGLSARILWQTLLLTILAGLAVCFALRTAGPSNEASYFADRYLMYQGGGRLFRDFEFSYGPLMFYLPIWISRLGHLSMTDSYLLAWLLQWVAGLIALWKLVGLATGGSKQGRVLYLIFWGFFAGALLDVGTNYTPLRFTSGPLLALLVYRLYVSGSSSLRAFVLAAISIPLLMFYSPEQGLSFASATILFFLFNFAPRRPGFVPGFALVLVSLGTSLLLANRIGLLQTMSSFKGGGFAFPLVFSLQNIFLLLLLMTAICGVWGTLRQRKFEHPLFYVCLLAAALAPAAFSRSDPGHIIINMLGALLTGFIVLMPHPLAWRGAKYAFLVLFVLLANLLHTYNMRGLAINSMRHAIQNGARDGFLRRVYAYGMEQADGRVKAEQKLAALDAYAANATSVARLGSGPMLAPLGGQPQSFDAVGFPVLSGRYAGLLPLMNVTEPWEKIQELEAHPDLPLVLPAGDHFRCLYSDREERLMLESVLTPIYLPRFVHAVTLAQPLCDYIEAHYQRTSTKAPDLYSEVWIRVR
jgi:hypothetical protein